MSANLVIFLRETQRKIRRRRKLYEILVISVRPSTSPLAGGTGQDEGSKIEQQGVEWACLVSGRFVKHFRDLGDSSVNTPQIDNFGKCSRHVKSAEIRQNHQCR